MRKRKEGWEEANSWHAIYLVVSVGTKPPLVHVVQALTQEYYFPVTKFSQEHHLTWHKGSPIRHSPSSLGHLDAASTKELLHLGRGSPCPSHSVLATPQQAEGSKTIADEPLRPQGFRRTLYNLMHSRITSHGVTPVFPKKTKCKFICMPGSSFMHIVTYKWITIQYHVRKREIIRDLRLTLEMKAPNITGSRLGLRTPRTSNIFIAASSFLGKLFIARVSTCRTQQVQGKVWMQMLYSGLGSKHLAF
jgi:hypothetical protein